MMTEINIRLQNLEIGGRGGGLSFETGASQNLFDQAFNGGFLSATFSSTPHNISTGSGEGLAWELQREFEALKLEYNASVSIVDSLQRELQWMRDKSGMRV